MGNNYGRTFSDVSSVMDVGQYIGQPWHAVGLNCWDLVRKVYADLGVELPLMQVDADNHKAVLMQFKSADTYRLWDEVPVPTHLDVVVLRMGKSPCHVGLSVQGGLLHSIAKAGVVFSDDRHLHALGFSVHSYWRYRYGLSCYR